MRPEEGVKCVTYTVWSTQAYGDSQFFKSLVLKNSGPSMLTCGVRATPPFYIDSIDTTDACEQPSVESFPVEFRDWENPAHVLNLPRGAILSIFVRFRPSKLWSASQETELDVNERLSRVFKGELTIRYANQVEQVVGLEATVLQPCLVVTPPNHDFGRVHVETRVIHKFHLCNSTVVPAKWKVVHVAAPETESEEIDDESCWSFESESGVVPGPTLPPESANAVMPQGFDADGKRRPVPIFLAFHPKQSAPYKSRFRILVERGISFDLVVKGHGSFEEADDNSVKRLPRPRY